MAEVIYKVKKIDVKIYIKNQELKKMLQKNPKIKLITIMNQ